MEHSKKDALPTIDVRHADIDPWDEFLSEESDELQALQSGPAGADTAPPRDEPPMLERVEVTPSTSLTPDVEPRAADVVRVLIAPPPTSAPPPASDTTADVSDAVPAIEASPVLTDQERLDRLRSLAPFAIRRESREITPSAESRVPADHSTPDQVLSPTFLRSVSAPSSEPARAVKAPDVELPQPPTVSKPSPVHARDVARPIPSPALIANGLSLREVLARQTPVQWPEAVAVVEELCAELSAASQSTIPDLADVLITSGGRLLVRPGAVGDPDIATLGRILHALLASATPPLPLRLFVTSSISSDRFTSVTLYAEALSYYGYGTPRRTELIRALYQRAAASSAPEPARVEARAQIQPQEKILAVERSRRGQLLPWTAAVLVGGVIGTGVALVMWPSSPQVLASLKSTPPSAPVQPHDDWQLGSLTVNETFRDKKRNQTQSARVGSKPAAALPKSTGAAAATASKMPVAPSASSPSPLPSASVLSGSAGAPPAVIPPARAAITPSIEARATTVATAPPAVAASPAPPPVDPTVYSEQDRDVIPPVMLTKLSLPSPYNSPTDSQVSSTLELIVDTTGHVVSAKFVDRPTRLPDFALPQQAKLWLFTPATKNGHPVSYRYFLRTTTSPR
jgi:hypothetical protein